jgi:hypothetical protein
MVLSRLIPSLHRSPLNRDGQWDRTLQPMIPAETEGETAGVPLDKRCFPARFDARLFRSLPVTLPREITL